MFSVYPGVKKPLWTRHQIHALSAIDADEAEKCKSVNSSSQDANGATRILLILGDSWKG